MEDKIIIPSALSINSDNDISLAASCTAAQVGACIIECQTTSEQDCDSYEGCTAAEVGQCVITCQTSSEEEDPCVVIYEMPSDPKPSVGTGVYVSDITSTSAYVTFDSIDGAVEYRIAYREDTTSVATTFIVDSSGFYLTGLKPNTEYVINYEGINSSGVAGGYMSSGRHFTTLSLYWSWTSSNGIATDLQTIAAYNAVTNNGILTDFSYLVWNDMCNFILTVMQTKGHSWISSQFGLTFNETLMTSDDKYMTAARFNSLRYNVGRIYSTGISEVSKGDIIYGSYFVDLMDKVNEWIEE